MEHAIDPSRRTKRQRYGGTGAGESWCAGQDISCIYAPPRIDPDERARSMRHSHPGEGRR